MIALEKVTKSIGKTPILHGIDLKVDEGEFIVLVGPSGSGKSTLLRLICGLDQPTSGDIYMKQRCVTELEPVERDIAMVFQSYALYPHLTVFDNLAFPLESAGWPKPQRIERVNQTLALLGLEHRAKHKPKALSGGERQRVAIGRAIVRRPKVFLFDEPLSNLDTVLRTEMRAEITALHQSLGSTMIYVTHDQVEAMTMADKVGVVHQGRIEQFDTPLNLYHYPVNQFVARFIGQQRINLIPAQVTEIVDGALSVVDANGHHYRPKVHSQGCKVGDRVTVGLRPESLSLCGGDSAIRMTCQRREALGHVSHLFGHLEDSTPLTATLYTELPKAQHITLHYCSSSLHLFDAAGVAYSRLAHETKE
ncbi:ABC transporter ATP-binding protein [Vibrio sp. WXL210]|uniref:ABC transporter ATP-binding protein n=1 Tax=Vibrio sp. WXL210 TaxID=3450709 RepID=UPI003EC4EDF1